MHRDDVAVIHRGERPRLAVIPLVGVAVAGRRRQLERHDTLQPLGHTPADLATASVIAEHHSTTTTRLCVHCRRAAGGELDLAKLERDDLCRSLGLQHRSAAIGGRCRTQGG